MLLAALTSACAFDDAVPAVSIRCRFDAQCPTRHVCRPVVDRCVSLATDALSDVSLTPSRAGPGTVISASFTAGGAAGTPRVWLSSTEGEVLGVFNTTEANGSRFRFSWTMDTQTPSGQALVFVDLPGPGSATTLGLELGTVELDTSGPRVLFPRVELVRAADNPLVAGGQGSQLERLRGSGQVLLSFATDEALSPTETQRVVFEHTASRAQVPGTRQADQNGRLVWAAVMPADAAEGPWVPSTTLTDLVGNVRTTRLAEQTVVVDRTRPPVPQADRRGAIVFRKALTGDRRGPAPNFSVRGQAGSVEGPGAVRVRVNGLPGPVVRARADGSFGPVTLQIAAEPDSVDVSAIDLAGNVSDWVRVVDHEVLLGAQNHAGLSLWMTGAHERCLPGPSVAILGQPPELSADDGRSFEVASGWGGREVLTDDGLGTRRPRLVFDAFAGALFAVGPSSEDGSGTWAGRWTGRGWMGASSRRPWLAPGFGVAFLRSRGIASDDFAAVLRGLTPRSCDGRPANEDVLSRLGNSGPVDAVSEWDLSTETRVTVPSPSNTLPLAQPGASLVYDAARRGMLYTHGLGAPRTWLRSSDGRWRLATSSLTPPPRTGAIIGFDALRQVVWLVGGWWQGQLLSDAWTWDGANWKQEPPMPVPMADGALALEPVSRSLILVAGQTATGARAATFTLQDGGWALVNQALPTPARPTAGRVTATLDGDGGLLAVAGVDFAPVTSATTLSFGAPPAVGWRYGGTWERLDAVTPVSGSATLGLDGQGVLLLGGRRPDAGLSPDLFRLDGGTWVVGGKGPPQTAAGRLNPLVASDDVGRLVQAGGALETGQWSTSVFVDDGGSDWQLTTVWSSGRGASLSFHRGLKAIVSVGGGAQTMQRLDLSGTVPLWTPTTLRFFERVDRGAVVEDPLNDRSLAVGLTSSSSQSTGLEWAGGDLTTARPVLAAEVFKDRADFLTDAVSRRALRVEAGPLGTSVSTLTRSGTTPAFIALLDPSAAIPRAATLQSLTVWAKAGATSERGEHGVALRFGTPRGWDFVSGSTNGTNTSPRAKPGDVEWRTVDQATLEDVTIGGNIAVAVTAAKPDSVLALDAVELVLGYRISLDGGVP